MKKSIKIILITLIVLIGIILIDTLQARIRKSSPIISWIQKLDGNSYVDKGILIDTYYCINGDVEDVSWHFKTTKYICPIYNDKLDNDTQYNINNNLISLSIKENTLTNKGLILIIENKTEDKYNYGSFYSLEHFENNNWKELESGSFTSMAYGILPYQKVEETIDWSYHNGELSPGKYRILKSFTDKNNVKINSSVEFDIE